MEKNKENEEKNDSQEQTVVINKENIEKSLEVLGIDKGVENNPFTDDDEKEDLEKGEKKDEKKDEKDDLEKGKKKDDEEPKKKKKEEEEEEEGEEEEGVEKGKKKKKDNKNSDELIKGLNSSLEEATSIQEDIQEDIKKGFESVDKKFKALGELEKGGLELLSNLLDRVEKIETTPGQRKSILSQNDIIEKSFEEEELDGKKKFSISRNRKDIVELLKGKADLDSEKPNKKYSEALLLFESSNMIEKAIQNELFKEEDTLIVA